VNRQIILIAHNLRSAHNVGSLLRTAEGLGVTKVYLTGYTPYPKQTVDLRLPHLANKIHNRIVKTSLGAEESIKVEYMDNVFDIISKLKSRGFTVCILEQHKKSQSLPKYSPPNKVALVVGREVEGIEAEVLNAADEIVQIPMFGKKESFNVANAAAMALYHLKFN
jgi:23S rRNA (guanosine2251-2'-O)-methyltransferase